MMNGNYGGGWMMIIGVLVCVAIIVAVVWLMMRLLKNKQVTVQSALPQQLPPYQMNEQEYQLPPQQSTEAFYEDEKLYSYPQPVPYPQQQERPLD